MSTFDGLGATNHIGHHGGGANFLCLDVNVSYPANKFRDGFQSSSRMYGIEYFETALAGLFDYSLIESGSFYQFNIPCSVCMARGRTNQVMIPGQDKCPGSLRKEYAGYIMGPNHGQKHSGQYVCVDERPQIVYGSDGDQNGDHLYVVETECPALQCGPYVNGRELRCVVCTI